ncbi:MAG TPA: aspartate carbamoyltransferase catalytic subunit [Acidimicrobiia bacterium]|jgi:aspartate carbamoyltransferase catalytic subunit|nr:aspartate carbamoyltransferase catalytic subunit [Acidimicrobiia bacterium]
MKHLLAVDDLAALDASGSPQPSLRAGIETMLDLTASFVEVTQRDIPKVPALRGKTVASLFYEDSTRTRLSFETAAKGLGADTMTFSVSTSSVKKGESLLDTVQTIEAMGVDAIVVRHAAAGAAHRVASWTDASVVNAGDGRHEHPTQALLDAFTLRRHRGPSLDGCRVAIVGDIANSRVARSNVVAFRALGCDVTLVGPPTLIPPRLEGWPVTVSYDLDDVLPDVDVVYLLRIQRERIGDAAFPSLREYSARWGLTAERAARLKPDTLVMHPGPMNRGVEIAAEVADSARSLVTEQVANGVAVRMAVLWALLGSGGPVV